MKELFDELDARAEENNRLNTELDTRNGECDKLKTELNAQIKECDNLKCELQELWKERTDNKQLQEEYERLLQEKKLQEQSLAGRKPQIENSEQRYVTGSCAGNLRNVSMIMTSERMRFQMYWSMPGWRQNRYWQKPIRERLLRSGRRKDKSRQRRLWYSGLLLRISDR